jgi:hypothetical protein
MEDPRYPPKDREDNVEDKVGVAASSCEHREWWQNKGQYREAGAALGEKNSMSTGLVSGWREDFWDYFVDGDSPRSPCSVSAGA